MSPNAQRATLNAQPTVALAVSGHGFGHAVRCAEVGRELLARGAHVKVRSDAPRRLFPDAVEWIPSPGWRLDIGVAQHDGLELDIDETRLRWEEFAADFDARAEIEAQLLVEHGVEVLMGDIPPLAFAAAAQAGIPSAALTNFGWDWIYEPWPGFERIIDVIRAGYARADVLFGLPFHGKREDAFPSFVEIEDVPLIARRAQCPRSIVRQQLGVRDDAKLVLLSFGGFAVQGIDISALGQWNDYVFLVTQADSAVPGNVVVVDEAPADYVSLLSACDVVITKPGYGIVADCLANQVAMLFTDRGPFREYDILAEALPCLGRARYVPRHDVLRGCLGPHLDALLAADATWTDQRMDGASVVAQKLLDRVQNRS